MGISPRTLRPSSTFTPRSISGLALWLDASDSSTLFQDSDGTVPATATSDPVGYWGDKSGNGRHAVQATAGNRPVVGTQNSRNALTFDGTDDNLRHTPSTALGATEVTHVAVLRNNLTSQPSLLYPPGIMTSGNQARPLDRWQGAPLTGAVFVGTPQIDVTSPFRSLDSRFVFILDGKKDGVSAGTHQLREFINGASIYSATSTGTWATTSQRINIGTRDDGATRYKGDICELLMYDRRLTTTERQRLERYLSARWGITLAPQVSNADAQDWIDRVYANGGSVSSATAQAVDTFCGAVQAAGIRDRFLRLNLFCGSNLNACLTPLYRAASLGDTQLGNATDTNVGGLFVSGDYNETGATGGLRGNGSTKYLNTGLQQASVSGDGTGHMSAYYRHKTNPASTWRLIGAGVSGGANDYFYDVSISSGAVLRRSQHGGGSATFENTATNIPAWATNHLGMSRTSNTVLRDWFGPGIFAGTNTSVTPTGLTADIFVYAFNLVGTGAIIHSNVTLGGYSIGAALNDTQIAAFRSAMDAFQSTLGRNVSVP